jgi:hypothetical protein
MWKVQRRRRKPTEAARGLWGAGAGDIFRRRRPTNRSFTVPFPLCELSKRE